MKEIVKNIKKFKGCIYRSEKYKKNQFNWKMNQDVSGNRKLSEREVENCDRIKNMDE